jgi:hypothetical protein
MDRKALAKQASLQGAANTNAMAQGPCGRWGDQQRGDLLGQVARLEAGPKDHSGPANINLASFELTRSAQQGVADAAATRDDGAFSGSLGRCLLHTADGCASDATLGKTKAALKTVLDAGHVSVTNQDAWLTYRDRRGPVMNAYAQEILEQFARASRAIVPCECCRFFFLVAENEEAEPTAYAMAASAWERGVFGGASLEEVRGAMRGVLRKAYYLCPSCSGD